MPPALRFVLVDTLRVGVLALVALDLAWLLNGARRNPLDLTYRSPEERLQAAARPLQQPLPAAPARTIDLTAFQAFATRRASVVIDARSPDFYRLGHVPGAVNLPRESVLFPPYRLRQANLDRHRLDEIAVYCSDADCPDADLVARTLMRLGFRELRVYEGGWSEWSGAGLPAKEGDGP